LFSARCKRFLLSCEGFLPDYVFLPIHEGGHLLFGWFGHTIGVMGGTLLQLFVPLAVAVYFIFQIFTGGCRDGKLI